MNNKTENKQRYFVYAGNAYPHKNLPTLIKAFVLLNQGKSEKIALKLIVARSVFRQRMEKLVNELNAGSFIQILDYQTDLFLNKIYKDSVAFVFPSLSEGFGLPPMEAINAGTLAAVSKIPVLKEVYKKSVFYFDPHDIGSIKDTLQKILNLNQKDRQLLIKNSQDFLKRYSWKKMASQTLSVYQSVV